MEKSRKLIIPIMCLVLSMLLFAQRTQAQQVLGQIIDGTSNEGLPEVSVFIEEIQDGTVTDPQGKFQLNLEQGQYTLQISFLGYENLSRTILIENSVSVLDLGTIRLEPRYLLLNTGVVVTAQRHTRSPFKAPEAISVLRASEIEQNGSRTTAEALTGTTGVWMQKTNHGGGSPFIRGLTGNQTLLLLDGIRLNNSTYRYGPNQYFNTIDVLNIDQVEVLRGAGSVLYGSDALGGTIQVMTQSPRFSISGWEFGGQVFGRYLSDDMEQTGRAQLQLSGERLAVLAGFGYRNFGDLIAGGDLGREAPSSYQERAADVKALMRLNNRVLLTLAYNGVFQSDVGRYDQVAQRGYALYQFQPQNRQLGYARLRLDTGNPWTRQIFLTASFQHSIEGRESQRQGSAIRTEEEDEVNTLGLIAEIHSRPGQNWKVISGVEWYGDQVGSTTMRRNLETGISETVRGLYPDDSRAGNLAVFTSHTFDLERFGLNAGLRWNTFSLRIEDATFGDTRINPSALVGNLSARYALGASHALTASVNTGFRAPNINDLSTFGSFDFGIETPSSSLSPEKCLTLELGYKMKTSRLAANLSVYRTQLLDLISRVRSTYNGQPVYNGEDVYRKENVAEAWLTGVESDIDIALNNRMSVFANLTYTYGQNTTDDEPMRRIPPLNGRVAWTYRVPMGFSGQVEWWYAGRQDRLAAGDISDHRIADDGTPAWNVINLKTGYSFRWGQIQAGVQNLLDEAYRIHGSGVDGVGLSGWLSVRVKW